MKTQKLKTIFLGTPDFSLPSLELLLNHPHIDLKACITQPSKPAGRGQQLTPPAVAEFAEKMKIPCLQTENINKDEKVQELLQEESIDLIIVLAFGQFLGEKILKLPLLGCYNIHTSLLPKYRGAAPIQWAIIKGEIETGVSIQKMVKKMDAGDIVHSRKISISEDETGGQLYTRLKFLAALSLNDFLSDLHSGKIKAVVQDENKVCFAPILKKEDGHLLFAHKNDQEILNLIRGLSPWPGTFCFINGKRLKILRANVEAQYKLSPGEVSTDHGMLLVGCSNKQTLRLSFVQLEGKKSCSDSDLLRGIRDKITLS